MVNSNRQIEGVVRPPTPVEWFTIRITKKQLEWMKLLCRFHLAETGNDRAKYYTEKLMWCLDKWPKKEAA